MLQILLKLGYSVIMTKSLTSLNLKSTQKNTMRKNIKHKVINVGALIYIKIEGSEKVSPRR
jgi:Tfp pilus assembly protein PilO